MSDNENQKVKAVTSIISLGLCIYIMYVLFS